MNVEHVSHWQNPCSTQKQADKVKFLIDGENYFKHFMAAAKLARESIFILGWDFHKDALLQPDKSDSLTLGVFLEDLVEQCHTLEIFILIWDFSWFCAKDRDLDPILPLGWPQHPRIHFHYANYHPEFASIHEKIVCIDRRLAITGSMDLTAHRWDLRNHPFECPERVLPDGRFYDPQHEVSVMITGPLVTALWELCKQRWVDNVSAVSLPEDPLPQTEPWPDCSSIDISAIDCMVCRTQPQYQEQTEIQEIRKRLLELIGHANHRIYIENQYFTDETIADALIARLAEREGPEIILLLPGSTVGPFENEAIIKQQTALIERLKRNDPFERLLVRVAVTRSGTQTKKIFIHSKLMIVDDTYLHLGSSNLNKRSMVLDTECDLSFVATTESHRNALRTLLHTLLDEHIQLPAGLLSDEIAPDISVQPMIVNAQEKGNRWLAEYALNRKPDSISQFAAAVGDPCGKIKGGTLVQTLLGVSTTSDKRNGTYSSKILGLLPYIGSLIAVVAIGYFWEELFPVDTENMHQHAALMSGYEWHIKVFLTTLAFIALASLCCPVNLLLLFVSALFSPLWALCINFIGIAGSLMLTYPIGVYVKKYFGAALTEHFSKPLIERLRKGSVIEIALLRMLPVAPFCFVNISAGYFSIPVARYIQGSLLGMLPVLLLITFFGAGLTALLQSLL